MNVKFSGSGIRDPGSGGARCASWNLQLKILAAIIALPLSVVAGTGVVTSVLREGMTYAPGR